MIRLSLGPVAALLLASAWLPACGSSNSEKRPVPPLEEATRKELFEIVVWTASSPTRDKNADTETCYYEVESDPEIARTPIPVQVEHWTQCMENLGWARREQG